MIILILVIVLLILIGVFFKNNLQDNEESDDINTEITKIIDNAFSALKYLDVDEVNTYLDYEALVNKLDEMILKGRENDNVSELEKKLFGSLEWEVDNIQQVDDTTVEVSIKVTNKNFNLIVIDWIDLLRGLDDDNYTDEIKLEKFEEAFDGITETKTITKNILLVKDDEGWKIKVDTDLRDVIFTGMESIAEAVKKSQ